PFILWAVFIVHKTVDFKFKSLPLKNYTDYDEAIIEKNSTTYQLGEKLIKACKSWYKGGLIKFFFQIRNINKVKQNARKY
ncbi:alpha-2,3-sialyltransferase, partial [Campylobacter jejuni]|nr:alpha-2,3-sialyltransferase [Campylobacter jejuni]